MNLALRDDEAVRGYKSKSQIIRILTEKWFATNMYCPACGGNSIHELNANTPLVDFHCTNCRQNYQLKSKSQPLKNKILDSAHSVMMNAINTNIVPNFVFMHYQPDKLVIKNLILVPGHFIGIEHIEKRKPLSNDARRSGYVGCNILFNQIPKEGRIFIVNNGKILRRNLVQRQWSNFNFLKRQKLENRGWIYDVLNCVNILNQNIFTLNKIYQFEATLSLKHPQNYNIRPKIRQQLQILRDNGLLEFQGRGVYKRLWT